MRNGWLGGEKRNQKKYVCVKYLLFILHSSQIESHTIAIQTKGGEHPDETTEKISRKIPREYAVNGDERFSGVNVVVSDET